jgi:hypothetical protein
MSDCLITNISIAGRKRSKAKFKSFTSCNNAVTQTLTGVFKLNSSKIRQLSRPKNKIAAHSKIRERLNVDIAARGFKNFFEQQINIPLIIGGGGIQFGEQSQTLTSKTSDFPRGEIKAFTTVSGVINATTYGQFFLDNTYVDKFAGNITKISSLKNLAFSQKLYPVTDLLNENFVDSNTQTPNLFNKIDEGVFLGNYNENLGTGFRVSDDNESYIQPFSKSISGTYRYKCEVSPPTKHPKYSFLFFRIAAPISGTDVEIPPEYRLYNLTLEDPSGNLIIKYKDIHVKGDANYKTQDINYTTYISEPEIDNANLYTWQDNYPILNEGSGYKLNVDCDIICKATSFTEGFDFGYEEKVCDTPSVSGNDNDYLALDGAPLSTQSANLNPSNALRISAVEVANAGGVGIKRDNYVNLYLDFVTAGKDYQR